MIFKVLSRCISIWPLSAFFFVSLLFSRQPEPPEIQPKIQMLERILTENIIPFWYPAVLDRASGGYRLNHNRDGRWMGPAPKGIVTQARTVWFFSMLVNSGAEDPRFLEAAGHGFEFLRNKMWDPEYGGFYWEVDSEGSRATRPDKHLYGNSFGLYALSEYYAASKNQEAGTLADQLFQLMEEHAHDDQYGGYREFFRRDWSPPPGDQVGYMSVPPDVKLMNTHLHIMEALTTYYRVLRKPLARDRLIELMSIQSSAVVRKTLGACTDKYQKDWTPLQGRQYERVSYGHDIENIWLLVEAAEAAGLPVGPYVDLFQSLMDYALLHGFDWEKGGFFYSGPFNGQADDRVKSWWTQSEGLVATLTMFRLTGDQRYLDAFNRTFDWIVNHQVDWENGEWFGSIREDGAREGAKADLWKSPYHNGRAVQVVKQKLRAMSSGTSR